MRLILKLVAVSEGGKGYHTIIESRREDEKLNFDEEYEIVEINNQLYTLTTTPELRGKDPFGLKRGEKYKLSDLVKKLINYEEGVGEFKLYWDPRQ